MPEPIENFTLPRTDWVDEQGRIYKDALIDNLNAIETKLQEIQGLDIFEVTIPDASDIQVPDCNLSSPDNTVVNLKSFLEIVDIEDYPIECSFNGTKLTKLTWWHNYHYNRKVNVETNANDTNKFVNFNPSTGVVSASTTVPVDSVLIGMFTGNQIRGINSNKMVGISLLKALANMSIETFSFSKPSNNQITNYTNAGRSIGWAQTQKKGASINVTFRDTGRNYSE